MMQEYIKIFNIKKMIQTSLFLFIMGNSASAQYGCSLAQPASSASFGTTTSFNMGTALLTTSVANAGLQCRTAILSLFSQDYVKVTVTSSNTSYLVNANNPADKIPYEAYAYSNYNPAYKVTFGQIFNYQNTNILNLLGLFGGNSVSFPMYFRINTGIYNLSAGQYKDTVSLYWDWDICTGLGALGICLGRSKNTGTATINLVLTITNDCMITAPDANFGSAPLITEFSPVTGTISITCTKGTAYSVGLNNGQNFASGQRRIVSGANSINYEIYKGNTGTARWGSVGGERRPSSGADVLPGLGTGNINTPQGFIYRAVIPSGQPAKPAGTYLDTILIDITF